MKFPWSRQKDACEMMKALFSEFTPEEMKILESENCSVPHMYSFLSEESKFLVSDYSLEEARESWDFLLTP